jgi:hypothetical protein
MQLNMEGEPLEVAETLAARTALPIGVVIGRAIGLLKYCLDAEAGGRRLVSEVRRSGRDRKEVVLDLRYQKRL